MGSDAAIPNGHAPRDLGKKKKTNRSARLKQCKLDARREQWLSQAGTDNNNNNSNQTNNDASSGAAKGRGRPLPIDIPLSRPWGSSPETDCPSNSLGSHSSRSSSGGSCSRSISDVDDCEDDDRGSGEDGVLDDWEAVADALTASDIPPKADASSDAASGDSPGAAAAVEEQCDRDPDPTRGILRTPPEPRLVLRAWKPDDAFRPQSLPNLSKQRVLSKKLAAPNGANVGWLSRNFDFQPLVCPICYEELDTTDTSFFPCPCGFRLCLFCHKRILEADGRCPGCRKQYGSVIGDEMPAAVGLPVQYKRLAHSRSVNARR